MPLCEVVSTDDRGLQDVADALAGSHRVLVITGAGISTSIGIPVSCAPVGKRYVLTRLRTSDQRMDCTT